MKTFRKVVSIIVSTYLLYKVFNLLKKKAFLFDVIRLALFNKHKSTIVLNHAQEIKINNQPTSKIIDNNADTHDTRFDYCTTSLGTIRYFTKGPIASMLNRNNYTLDNNNNNNNNIADNRANKNIHNPIIFCADAPNVLEHFEMQFVDSLNLFKNRNIVAIEALGSGFSYPNFSFDFSLDHQVQALLEFIHNLKEIYSNIYASSYNKNNTNNSEFKVILCFSCGNVIASIELAKRYPKLVEKMMIIQCPGISQIQSWINRIDFYSTIQTPIIGQLLNRFAVKFLASSWYNIAVTNRSLSSSFNQLAIKKIKTGSAFSLASNIQQIINEMANKNIITQNFNNNINDKTNINNNQGNKQIIDCIIIWGNADRSHRRTQKDATKELITYYNTNNPNNSLLNLKSFITIDKASHFPHLEFNDLFCSILFDFIHDNSIAYLLQNSNNVSVQLYDNNNGITAAL